MLAGILQVYIYNALRIESMSISPDMSDANNPLVGRGRGAQIRHRLHFAWCGAEKHMPGRPDEFTPYGLTD